MSATTELKTYADYQQYNFFRTPDWRWERVLQLTDRPGDVAGRCNKRDDEIVRTAKAFVCRRKNGDAAMKDKLLCENPGLFYAYEYNERLQDDPEAAMYIQARVLARQSVDQIAAAMGLMPEAIKWYTDLYFDVIPHLDKRDWISKQVIIPAITKTLGAKLPNDNPAMVGFKDSAVARPFLDGTLKMFAYYGGPHLVDLMIGGMQAGKPLTGPDDVDNWMDRTVGTTVRRRTMQAAHVFEINKYNVMELFAAHSKLMEIARSEENQDQARSTMERHIKAVIEEIPWAVGSDGEMLYEQTVVGRFDGMAGELRDDELILVASGKVAVTVAPDNFPKQLPEPRKDKKSVLMTQDAEI